MEKVYYKNMESAEKMYVRQLVCFSQNKTISKPQNFKMNAEWMLI